MEAPSCGFATIYLRMTATTTLQWSVIVYVVSQDAWVSGSISYIIYCILYIVYYTLYIIYYDDLMSFLPAFVGDEGRITGAESGRSQG